MIEYKNFIYLDVYKTGYGRPYSGLEKAIIARTCRRVFNRSPALADLLDDSRFQSLVQLAQPLLRLTRIRDVDVDADHSEEVAVGIEAGLRLRLQQSILAIGPAVARFDGK